MASDQGDDPFGYILVEAGTVSSSQLSVALNFPFLNDDDPSPLPSPMMPADDSILICSLPQPQPQPETQHPSETNNDKESDLAVKEPNQQVPKKSGGSRRRSRGVRLTSSDSDEAAPTSRVLPATLRDIEEEEKTMDSSQKAGTCSANPPLMLQNSIKVENYENPIKVKNDENSSGKEGSCCANPTVLIRDPTKDIKMDHGDNSRRNTDHRDPTTEGEIQQEVPRTSNENSSIPMNFPDVLSLLTPPLDPRYADIDILDIAAMKGIHIEPPRWHRPGGYDKRKDSQ